jgi:hypothetical protein
LPVTSTTSARSPATATPVLRDAFSRMPNGPAFHITSNVFPSMTPAHTTSRPSSSKANAPAMSSMPSPLASAPTGAVY